MEIEEIVRIIDKHIGLNERELMTEAMKFKESGDEKANEMFHAHAGACTALKMLKMEITGERKWGKNK